MGTWLAVAVGGAAGSLARWQLSVWMRGTWPAFPWGTLTVNVLGSFAIGALWAYGMSKPLPDWLRLGLMSGLLGGFTTYSAFSLDTLELWRSGAAAALANVAANVVLSLAACALGAWLLRPAAG